MFKLEEQSDYAYDLSPNWSEDGKYFTCGYCRQRKFYLDLASHHRRKHEPTVAACNDCEKRQRLNASRSRNFRPGSKYMERRRKNGHSS